MGRTGIRWRRPLLGAVLGLFTLAPPVAAQEPGPSTTAVAPVVDPAPPVSNPDVSEPVPAANGLRRRLLTSPLEPLGEQGYVEHEVFFGGRAGVHEAAGEWGDDGRWSTTSESSKPYRTRMLVRRPADPAAFNGTVVVSWLDVTGAFDADEEWAAVGDELVRQGAAFVAVSAQSMGVSGPLGAAVWDPLRYGGLHVSDDALSYDIFSQAGQALKHPDGVDPLAGLSAERTLIATGRSQAAQRLVTYINAFHPVAQIYDGFLLDSRFPNAAPLGDAEVSESRLSLSGALSSDEPFLPEPRPTLLDGPPDAPVRGDTQVPVLMLLTETDVAEAAGNRAPDASSVRTWEVAGAAHLDRSSAGALVGLLQRDFPFVPRDQLTECATPNQLNAVYARRAAQRAIGEWVTAGTAPTSSAPIMVDDESGEIVRDADGNALGGLRLPDIDAPLGRHSGESAGDGFCSLVGSSTPFDTANLAARYPTRADYVAAYTQAAQAAVAAGHLLPEDAVTMTAAAATVDLTAPVVGPAAEAAASGAEAGAAGPAEPATADRSAAESSAAAPDEAAARRSDPGWMATTGWNLIAPLLGGLLLLVNGRVVLTIANQRKRGSRRD